MTGEPRAPAAGQDRGALRVEEIRPETARRWFEIGPVPADLPEACEELGLTLARTAPRTSFRYIASDGSGQVRAKIGGYVTRSGRLTFWAVRHRPGESRAWRRRLSEALVDACIRSAISHRHVRYVEAQPAHDTPDLALFLDVIAAHGLTERARAGAYCHDLPGPNPRAPAVPSPWSFEPCSEAGEEVLAATFELVQSSTFDRIETQRLLSAGETIAELRATSDECARTPLWFYAREDGRPIGYALCDISNTEPPAKTEGTILEVGVVPAARRRGVGSSLIVEALTRLRDREAGAIRSYIDDRNRPSIQLHEKLGFRREPGDYMTWRRLLADRPFVPGARPAGGRGP